MEKLEDFNKFNETIKYGLIVLDSLNEKLQTGMFWLDDIVHFVGYLNKPTELDIENLKEELSTDEDFGLKDISERLLIFEAPQEIVDEYIKILKNDENNN